MRLLASSRWLGLFAGFALMSIHAARETLSCHQLRQRHILRIYHSRRTMISYPLRGGELARFGPGSGNDIASIRTKCRTSSRSEVIPLTHCLVWPESDRNEQRDWFDGTTRLMGSMRPVSFQLGLRCSASGSTKSATPKWKVHCRSLQRRFTSTRDVAPCLNCANSGRSHVRWQWFNSTQAEAPKCTNGSATSDAKGTLRTAIAFYRRLRTRDRGLTLGFVTAPAPRQPPACPWSAQSLQARARGRHAPRPVGLSID
jgi:hypothetical protein